MNPKRIELSLAIILLLTGGCARQDNGKGMSAASSSPITQPADTGSGLPVGFTTDHVRSALADYINWRLWLYPDRVEGEGSNEFEPYVGQKLAFQLRVYSKPSGEERLYAQTDQLPGELLAFKQMDGTVYATGKVTSDDRTEWPGESFRKAGQLVLPVTPPHQPDYGSSPHKDQLISAAQEYAESVCKDLGKSSDRDQWEGARLTLANFYEFEPGTALWVLRKDDYAWYSPIAFEESGGTVKAVGSKGYGVERIHGLEKNHSSRFSLERAVSDAIGTYSCRNGTLQDN